MVDANAGAAGGALEKRRRRSARALVAIFVVGAVAGGAALVKIQHDRWLKRAAEDEEIPYGTPPGAGVLEGRFAKRRNLVARGGGSIATESAVEAGFKWLARHQSADGTWEAESFDKVCRGACGGHGVGSNRDTGLTGLALLALLGAGYGPPHPATYVDAVTGKTVRFGRVAQRGLLALLAAQEEDGRFGPDGSDSMSNHALATAALCEGYAMTAHPRYEHPARLAVDFLIRARNDDGGWGSFPRSGKSDALDTGWAVLALESAALAGIDAPPEVHEKARAWLKGEIARAAGGREQASGAAVFLVSAAFPRREPSAKGASPGSLVSPGAEDQPVIADPPAWASARGTNDFVYWSFGSIGLYELHGPSGPPWKRWNKAMADGLCQNQAIRKDGCRDGSWESDFADAWTKARGRVAATALGTLTLETYYRYPR